MAGPATGPPPPVSRLSTATHAAVMRYLNERASAACERKGQAWNLDDIAAVHRLNELRKGGTR